MLVSRSMIFISRSFYALVVLGTIFFTASTCQKILFKNNGYTGVLVAISDCINETENPNMISNLKRLLTQFSSSLYLATDNKAYLEEVTILIPTSWENNGYEEATGETFRTANFIVDHENPWFGDQPYAYEEEPEANCGKHWDKIHLTPEYINTFRNKPNDNKCINDCTEVTEPDASNIYPSCRSCTEYIQCDTNDNTFHQHCGLGTVFNHGHCGHFTDNCGATDLVHEWGHLRWGLGNEHPDEEYPETWAPGAGNCSDLRGPLGECYQDKNGTVIVPNSCSADFLFKDPECYIEDVTKCRFELKDNQIPAEVQASVMFNMHDNPSMSTVTRFCGWHAEIKPTTSKGDLDEDKEIIQGRTHNRFAYNQQNIICRYRSAWEVMAEHEDFANDLNPRRALVETQPRFTLVQQRKDVNRVVLVMDVSGSMSSTVPGSSVTRLNRMSQDAEMYIMGAPNGTYIGLVEFGTTAWTTHELVLVNTNRASLVQALPDRTSGLTCIGCGLQQGMTVLRTHNANIAGGRILLITDGGENQNPRMNDVTPELVAENVIVDSIQYTAAADPNVRFVSEDTGGEFFRSNGSINSTEMIEGLLETLTSRHTPCSEAAVVSLMTDTSTLVRNQVEIVNVIVDRTVGYNTQFSFTFPPGSAVASGKRSINSNVLDVDLVSPSGQIFESSDPDISEYNNRIGSFRMTIPGRAEAGNWKTKMTNRLSTSFTTQIVATSSPPSADVEPITATASMRGSDVNLRDAEPETVRIFCRVNQGHSPVLYATVKAYVDTEVLSLSDDGTGVDVSANDGVYTGQFVRFTSSGRHSVFVIATNDNGNASVALPQTGQTKKRKVTVSQLKLDPVGPFRRSSAAGFITVTNHPGAGIVPNVVPPGRITDLRLVRVSRQDKTAQLTWTAVGSDLYEGTAEGYDLRSSKDFDQILTDFDTSHVVDQSDLEVGNLSSPRSANEQETIIIRLTDEQLDSIEHYAIRAYDAGSRKGEVSNIVRVFAPVVLPLATTEPPPTTPTDTPHPTTLLPTPRPLTTRATTESSPTEGQEEAGPSLGVILSGVCALLLVGLLIGVVVLILYVKKAGKRNDHQRLMETSSQASNTISKASLPDFSSHAMTRNPTVVGAGGQYPFPPPKQGINPAFIHPEAAPAYQLPANMASYPQQYVLPNQFAPPNQQYTPAPGPRHFLPRVSVRTSRSAQGSVSNPGYDFNGY